MRDKAFVLENLKNTYCRLKPSGIDGVGVFAVRDIPEGAFPFSAIEKEAWFLFRMEELEGLHPAILKMIDDFFVIEDGAVAIPDLCLDGMNLTFRLNHSKEPNVTWTKGGRFVTLREIRAGEELTVDYSTFDPKYS